MVGLRNWITLLLVKLIIYELTLSSEAFSKKNCWENSFICSNVFLPICFQRTFSEKRNSHSSCNKQSKGKELASFSTSKRLATRAEAVTNQFQSPLSLQSTRNKIPLITKNQSRPSLYFKLNRDIIKRRDNYEQFY